MFHSNTIDESLYSSMMEQIKHVNEPYIQSLRQKARKKDAKRTRNYIRQGDFSAAMKIWTFKARRKIQHYAHPDKPDYFSFDKIAVYTVITGNYDELLEPYCHPDNCDFFVFTDKDLDVTASTWTKRAIPDTLNGLSDPAKNRYLKMHPQEIFGDYKYSVYVDGNIQIFTDLTEYVNKLGPVGIGTHMHSSRHCVYEEMQAIRKQGKETDEEINRHLTYLKESGMPRNYGLLECNVIAREHHNSTCIKIMEEWWQEYCKYSKRDQVSLPHVLFRNGIKVKEVGVLGNNVRANPSFRIFRHTLNGQPSGSKENGQHSFPGVE